MQRKLVATLLEGGVSFDFKGLAIRELTPSNLGSASLAEVRVDPNVAHPRARSNASDKVYICLRGQVEFRIGGQKVDLPAGAVLTVVRNQWFEYKNRESSPAVLLLVHVPPFDIAAEEFAAADEPAPGRRA